MIEDNTIDLTVDRKFSKQIHRREVGLPKFVAVTRDTLEWGLKRSTFLPWNTQPVTSELSSSRLKRSYGDVASDEYGATLRITSNNDIMVFERKEEYKDLVLEEFFMELRGGFPYIALATCFSCGRKKVRNNKEINWNYFTCDKCLRKRKSVPWIRR